MILDESMGHRIQGAGLTRLIDREINTLSMRLKRDILRLPLARI